MSLGNDEILRVWPLIGIRLVLGMIFNALMCVYIQPSWDNYMHNKPNLALSHEKLIDSYVKSGLKYGIHVYYETVFTLN